MCVSVHACVTHTMSHDSGTTFITVPLKHIELISSFMQLQLYGNQFEAK